MIQEEYPEHVEPALTIQPVPPSTFAWRTLAFGGIFAVHSGRRIPCYLPKTWTKSDTKVVSAHES